MENQPVTTKSDLVTHRYILMQKGNLPVTCQAQHASITQQQRNELATIMNAMTILFGNAMIAAVLVSAPAVAAEVEVVTPVPVLIMAEQSSYSTHDPAKRMSLEEYESYRAELQRQIGDANRSASLNDTEADVKEVDQSQAIPAGNGYGQGYRTRHRHGHDGTGMNFNRGGSMGTGAGRNR